MRRASEVRRTHPIMLFYIKKYIWLELAATLLLGGSGYAGIHYFNLPFDIGGVTYFRMLMKKEPATA